MPEALTQTSPTMQPPLVPNTGQPYNPVATLNGWSLPWCMNNGVREFHLVAEPVVREFAPGMKANLWGYNGSSPGPTIEAVEGDRVRIFVTNKLPEHTTVHWHGIMLPSGMDGVGGLTQPHIPPGKTFVYELPVGSPGMEVGSRKDPYLVLLIDKAGRSSVFASYPKSLKGEFPMKAVHTLVIAISLFDSAGAFAQSAPQSGTTAAATAQTEGEVRKVDLAQGKVTLRHSP